MFQKNSPHSHRKRRNTFPSRLSSMSVKTRGAVAHLGQDAATVSLDSLPERLFGSIRFIDRVPGCVPPPRSEVYDRSHDSAPYPELRQASKRVDNFSATMAGCDRLSKNAPPRLRLGCTFGLDRHLATQHVQGFTSSHCRWLKGCRRRRGTRPTARPYSCSLTLGSLFCRAMTSDELADEREHAFWIVAMNVVAAIGQPFETNQMRG